MVFERPTIRTAEFDKTAGLPFWTPAMPAPAGRGAMDGPASISPGAPNTQQPALRGLLCVYCQEWYSNARQSERQSSTKRQDCRFGRRLCRRPQGEGPWMAPRQSLRARQTHSSPPCAGCCVFIVRNGIRTPDNQNGRVRQNGRIAVLDAGYAGARRARGHGWLRVNLSGRANQIKACTQVLAFRIASVENS